MIYTHKISPNNLLKYANKVSKQVSKQKQGENNGQDQNKSLKKMFLLSLFLNSSMYPGGRGRIEIQTYLENMEVEMMVEENGLFHSE